MVLRSQRKLLIANGFLLLLLLIAQFDDPLLAVGVNDETAQSDNSTDFFADFDSALQIRLFLRDKNAKRAYSQRKVEKRRIVRTFNCSASSRNERQATQFTTDTEWQKATDPSSNFQLLLYSAYMDRRENSLFPDVNSVQVISMTKRRGNQTEVFCQFFDEGDFLNRTAVVRGHIREIWHRLWDPREGFYMPALITCPIPSDTQPKFISLTLLPCDEPTNLLPVRGGRDTTIQDKIAVCVKGMNFIKDISAELVEWLELQYLLGADRIVIYTYYVHPRTAKVLDFYEKKQKLVQIPLTLPDESPNQPFIRNNYIQRNRAQKRRNELIPYNDCFYRHIETHRYVLIIDTDEVVVPLEYPDWPTMLDAIREQHENADDFTAISITNAYRLSNSTKRMNPSIPQYMYMLRHRRRSVTLSKQGHYIKSFMYSPNVATVFNHYPLHRLRPNLKDTHHVDPQTALKLHYRDNCLSELSKKACIDLLRNTTDDPSLDRFAPKLIKKVTKVLKKLSLI